MFSKKWSTKKGKIQKSMHFQALSKKLLCMSIHVVGYDEIVTSMGGAEFLQDTCYAKYLREVEQGDGARKFNVTVLANLDELPEDQWSSFAYDWACMKRNQESKVCSASQESLPEPFFTLRIPGLVPPL